MDFKLSIRKQNTGLVFYATKKVWAKELKRQKNIQVYLGSFRNGRCNFNDNAKDHAALFAGTDYEREYWLWRSIEKIRQGEDTHPVVTTEDIVDAEVKNAGVALVLDKLASDLRLPTYLNQVFDDVLASKILSLAYYCACGNRNPLGRAQIWFEDHITPWNQPMSDTEISRVLSEITPSDILKFQSLWVKTCEKSDRLCFDITSVSSYGRGIPDVTRGYNRDRENLPQINLLMLVSQRTKLPVWFEQLPGAVADINTVKDTIRLIKSIDGSAQNFIMDRGFASDENIRALLDARIKFTMGLPLWRFEKERQEVRKAYEANEFCDPVGTIDMFDEHDILSTQSVTRLWKIHGHRAYLHMYYTDYYRASDNAQLMDDLNRIRADLMTGRPLTLASDQALAKMCFTVHDTPKRGRRVTANNEAIASLRNNCDAGFFVILSSQFKDASEALAVYKLRDSVEKRFDDLKNDEDLRRLRVHSSRNMQARLFIQFIAEILRCRILAVMQSNNPRPQRVRTVTDVLWAVDSVRIVSIAGHRPFYKRATKLQREIFDFFGVVINPKQWPSLMKN